MADRRTIDVKKYSGRRGSHEFFSLRDPAEADTKLNWVGRRATAKSTRTAGQGLGQEDKVQRPKAKRKRGWTMLEGVGTVLIRAWRRDVGFGGGYRYRRSFGRVFGGGSQDLEDKQNAMQRNTDYTSTKCIRRASFNKRATGNEHARGFGRV